MAGECALYPSQGGNAATIDVLATKGAARIPARLAIVGHTSFFVQYHTRPGRRVARVSQHSAAGCGFPQSGHVAWDAQGPPGKNRRRQQDLTSVPLLLALEGAQPVYFEMFEV